MRLPPLRAIIARQMRTLICGSIAYDTIMVFRDRFKNHILPDQLHILNVAFLVPDLRREFGGCAGNIAYTLKMLGGDPLIMATVGDDYPPYAERLERLAISQQHIRKIAGTFTAQAFITTDLDDNQITAFHPGAMNHSHANHVSEAKGATLGIVAPDGRDGMLQHARECHEAGIPFVFDPGPGPADVQRRGAARVRAHGRLRHVNDYEGQMLQERTGKTLEALSKLVEGFRGHIGGARLSFTPEVVRSRCLALRRRKWSIRPAAAMLSGRVFCTASRRGTIGRRRDGWRRSWARSRSPGAAGRTTAFTRDEIAQRYRDEFGTRIW